MLPGFENVKNSTKIDEYKIAYESVEHKLKIGKEPKMEELRKWFIYKMEQDYNTKMLGTNIHYCYKTFNKLKEKYSLCNYELAKKLIQWSTIYKKDFSGTFDFSCLNTNWLIEKLNSQPSYHINNDYTPNTNNRRI